MLQGWLCLIPNCLRQARPVCSVTPWRWQWRQVRSYFLKIFRWTWGAVWLSPRTARHPWGLEGSQGDLAMAMTQENPGTWLQWGVPPGRTNRVDEWRKEETRQCSWSAIPPALSWSLCTPVLAKLETGGQDLPKIPDHWTERRESHLKPPLLYVTNFLKKSRYNNIQHITMCKFKVYNVFIWYIYIL